MRQRHALYLSEAMTHQLQAAAETHRVSKSAILERALQQFLAPQSNGTSTNLQTLQQETMQRSLNRLERDLAVGNELTAIFVRYFLMITPPLPASEHDAAQITGQLRFDQVIETIAARIRTDRALVARVMATLSEAETETETNLDTSHKPPQATD
jgi:predicted transcriptional regulator